MDAKEVIERFCVLQGTAAAHVGFEHAADCFCKQSGFWGGDDYGGLFAEGYRNDGEALEFIEQAVLEKIEREKVPNRRVERRPARCNEHARCRRAVRSHAGLDHHATGEKRCS